MSDDQHAPSESESATDSTCASTHDGRDVQSFLQRETNRRGETVLFIGPGAPHLKVDLTFKVIEIPTQQHHLMIVVKPSTEQPDEWTVNGNTLDVFSPGYPLSALDDPRLSGNCQQREMPT